MATPAPSNPHPASRRVRSVASGSRWGVLARIRRRRARRHAMRHPLWEAFRLRGPQQVLRLSPWLTRAVTLWAMLALLATDLPLRAATLYWTGTPSGTWSPLGNWTTNSGSLSLSPGTLGGWRTPFSSMRLPPVDFPRRVSFWAGIRPQIS